MPINNGLLTLIFVLPFTVVSCSSPSEPDTKYSIHINKALTILGLDEENISLPKVPYPISTRARLPLVDSILMNPPSVIDIGNRLNNTKQLSTRSQFLSDIVKLLDKTVIAPEQNTTVSTSNGLIQSNISDIFTINNGSEDLTDDGYIDIQLKRSLLSIYSGIVRSVQLWEKHGGNPTHREFQLISPHLSKLLEYHGSDTDIYRILPEPYHSVGARINSASLLSSMLQLLVAVENELATFTQSRPINRTTDWETPYGMVRLAGNGNDNHEGNFLLLVDLGGDDTYNNVGAPPNISGTSYVVIDIKGNDDINWSEIPGPGSGVLGTGIWLDLDGNDQYKGDNIGLGAALFGIGLFWDEAGDDTYDANVLAQGVGQYGTGIFVDMQGNDAYKASMAGQGYGGPGGIGILIDSTGNDTYVCGGKIPDRVEARVKRHRDIHYLSFCQGYSFGLRPDISGGIGLLIDHSGDDVYKADIFAQGGAYWFGLGMLIDGSGNDTYEAFEHAQGESLHLGAGFLGDWGGNDLYTGFEHVQGVGIDRASGILYDDSGDDTYKSHNESQGTGVKPYGVGILIDNKGNDSYDALRDSQGNAKPDLNFPESEWPIGILLDLDGLDTFTLPYSEPIGSGGRILNRQGISIDM